MAAPPHSPGGAWIGSIFIALALLLLCSRANATERPFTLQVGGGVRTFNNQVGLDDAPSFSLRAGLGMTDRISLAIDAYYSSTSRTNTGASANVEGLRGMVRASVLTGPTRPYAVLGGGAVNLDFRDAYGYSVGTVTGGIGVSRRIGPRKFVEVEGDLDFYRNRVISYDRYGFAARIGPYTARHLSSVMLSIGYEF